MTSAGNSEFIAIQPDGKIVLSGLLSVDGVARGLVRLNADGSVDSSLFPASVTAGGKAFISNTGQIVLSATVLEGGVSKGKVLRFDQDGTLNLSVDSQYTVIGLQADGRILTGLGMASSSPIRRLNQDGSDDTAFNANAPSLDIQFGFPPIAIVEPDGRIAVGAMGLVRLDSDGKKDATFTPSTTYDRYWFEGLVRQPDGKYVGGGWPFYDSRTIVRKRLFRINHDGSVDQSFDAHSNEQFGPDVLVPLAIRNDGTIFAAGDLRQGAEAREGIAAVLTSGAIDPTFDAGPWTRTDAQVTTVVEQSDGKLLIAGPFTSVNGDGRPGIARINADGTTDEDFTPSPTVSGRVDAAAIQPDGKILIGGYFTIDDQGAYGLVRMNGDGSIDAGFTPGTIDPLQPPSLSTGICAIAVLNDGRILVGGSFTNYGGSGRNTLARLSASGSVDGGYTATASVIFSDSRNTFVPLNGKIYYLGVVTQDTNTCGNCRFNGDGRLDPDFKTLPTRPYGYSNPVVLGAQPDGKLIATEFLRGGETDPQYIVRLFPDGTTDTSFALTLCLENTRLAVAPGGRIIEVGRGYYDKPNNIRRIRPDGGVESGMAIAAQWGIYGEIITRSGKLIVYGRSLSAQGQGPQAMLRFNLDLGPAHSGFDYDGDGKTDESVFRPSNGTWYLNRSQAGFTGYQFGINDDLVTPADYTGDGKTDVAVFRPATGTWFVLKSEDNTFYGMQFGSTGDIPVPGDFDGDGKADFAVYRPVNGTWYIQQPNGDDTDVPFGIAEDRPTLGDFDGDGKTDIAVFRPSTGVWYRLNSSDGSFFAVQFGQAGDKVVAADYTGDGKTDIAVYRPSEGTWYIMRSEDSSFYGVQFGINIDLPTPGDYDGDGKADVAVFRPSDGTWYEQRSTSGFAAVQFGTNGDKPVPNAYVY